MRYFIGYSVGDSKGYPRRYSRGIEYGVHKVCRKYHRYPTGYSRWFSIMYMGELSKVFFKVVEKVF